MIELLKILYVSYVYDDIKALDGITFSVSKGEFLGIIGPNGSKKSTLLKTIVRSLKLTSGNILLEGRTIHEMKRKELAKKMAFVCEETHVDFPFTCFEIVLMGRTPYIERFSWEKAEDYKIAEEAMRMTDTVQFMSREINELSAGEKQRVIIARALAQKPDLLLLDEPTSHLDISHQKEIFDLLRKLNISNGLTIITVLHDINLAALYCKRLILLKKGKIFIQGKPEEVITEKNIENTYRTEVRVSTDKSTGVLNVAIVPSK